MNRSQAEGAVRLLFDFFPNLRMSQDVIEAWAQEIERYESVDAFEAARDLGRTAKYRPTLAEFMATIIEARRRRTAKSQKPSTMKDYGDNVGVRAPADDELDDDKYAEAVKMRGKMVGDR